MNRNLTVSKSWVQRSCTKKKSPFSLIILRFANQNHHCIQNSYIKNETIYMNIYTHLIIRVERIFLTYFCWKKIRKPLDASMTLEGPSFESQLTRFLVDFCPFHSLQVYVVEKKKLKRSFRKVQYRPAQ